MARVVFATEAVFEVDEQGRVWAMAGFGETLWSELLDVFDEVTIVARAQRVAQPTLTVPVADPRVTLFPLPFYQGPGQFVRAFPGLVARVRVAAQLDGAFLLRLPGPVGTMLAAALKRGGRRYAVQLVGDPHDVLGGGGLGRGAARLRATVVTATQWAVRSGAAVAYVTGETLQRRYPPGSTARAFAASDINLTPEWFGAPRATPRNDPPRLFLCGSLAQRYKGVDLLIDATASLRAAGVAVQAVVAGDGRFRGELQEQARRCGLADEVRFLGAISAEAIRDELDRADLFVMPSRTEGMPRALIEAMARGLPAVGSDVGGIVELLPPERRFAREDVAGFAAAIAALLGDRQAYAAASERNLTLARSFAAEVLAPKRAAFYRAVRDMAEESR